jgi:hypothetical protein
MLKTVALALALTCTGQVASAAFSEGCRVGQLTKYSVKGLWNKSGEGEMMIGRLGGAFTTPSRGESKGKQLNPWVFSTEEMMKSKMEAHLGQYAVICYEQAQYNTGWSYGTDYLVKTISPVEGKEPNLDNCEVVKPKTLRHDGGTRIGRIAKASQKGRIAKSFEVIVQQGDSGSNFIEMSISDEHMYNCAMLALRSGKQVRIDYVEYAYSVKRATNYDIYKISVVNSDM